MATINLIDLMADPVVIVDKHGHFLEINNKVEEITGLKRNELIGKNFLRTKILTSESKIITIKNLAKRMAGFEVKPYEVDIIAKDGEKLRYEINAKKIEYAGKPSDFVIFRDITYRDRIEKEFKQKYELMSQILKRETQRLIQNEEKFRNITESSIDIIYETDLEGKITYISPSTLDITGFHQEEIVGKYIHQLDITLEKSKAADRLTEIREGRKIKGSRLKLVKKDGEPITVEINSAPIIVSGKIRGSQGIIRDITDQLKIQESLRSSEDTHKKTSKFLNQILSNMSDYVWVVDEDYYLRFYNENARKIHGDAHGKKCYQILENRNNPCHHSGIPCEVHEILEKGKSYFECKRSIDVPATSTKKIIHKRANPTPTIEGKKAIISLARDVTDETLSKEQLEKSSSVLHATLESTADGILVVNQNNKITNYNQRWHKMFNIPISILASLDGKELMRYTLEKIKEPEKFERKSNELFDNPELESFDVFEWKDGRIFERYSRPQLIEGKTAGRVISFRDITKRKQYEKQIIKSKQFLESVIDNIPDPVVIKDKNLRYVFINKAQSDMLGKSKNEILGKTSEELFPNNITEAFKKNDLKIFTKSSSEEIFEENITDQNNVNRIFQTKKTSITDDEGKESYIVAVARDITKQSTTEKNLKIRVKELSCLYGISRIIERSKTLDAIIHETVNIIPHAWQHPDTTYCKIEYYNKISKSSNFKKTQWKQKAFIKVDGNKIGLIEVYHISKPELHNNPFLDDEQALLNIIAERTSKVIEHFQAEDRLRIYSEQLKELLKEKTGELRESEKHYRHLIESTPEMIFIHDGKKFLYVNPAAVELLGANDTSQIIGRDIQSIIHPDYKEISRERIHKALHERFSVPLEESKIIRLDGTTINVEEISIPAIYEGKPTVQGVVRDITERKKLEEMKDQFISAATHELRTPLISIIGYVDYILAGKMGLLKDKIHTSLEVVMQNANRLLSLTDDLLDMRKIQSGKFQVKKEPIDFWETIYYCSKEAYPLLNEKKLKLKLNVPDKPLKIQGDQIRLNQVLMNLLSNATKFSPEGEVINLSVKEKADEIQVQVSDKGIGIQKKDFENIFKPFADIKKQTYIKGTGLGLSITKAIVEAHGGTIKAQSPGEGKGSTFIFTLPNNR